MRYTLRQICFTVCAIGGLFCFCACGSSVPLGGSSTKNDAVSTGDQVAAGDATPVTDEGNAISDGVIADTPVVSDTVAPSDLGPTDAKPPADPGPVSDVKPPNDTGKPDVGPADVDPAYANSSGGCQTWSGPGCGGCACEAAVCNVYSECCDTLWGKACVKQCGKTDPKCAGDTTDGDLFIEEIDAGSGPIECIPTYSGSIPGAKLDLSATPCHFSLSKLAAGFALPYKVVVEKSVALAVNDDNISQCPPPKMFGGVNTFLTVSGLSDSGLPQNWCMCDIGLCTPKDPPYLPTTPGTYSDNFVWVGKNFEGPSDTGNQPGATFPPGIYEFKVKSTGNFKKPDNSEDFYSETATLKIQLTP